MIKIAIGSDHRGFKYKEELIKYLSKNYIVKDFGTFIDESCDYPDFAHKVGKAVASKKCNKGILICGSGNGMCITANKVNGVRAVVGYSAKAAEFSVRHNNANIICFSEDFPFLSIIKALKKFLSAKFEGGRHLRRVNKIKKIDDGKI